MSGLALITWPKNFVVSKPHDAFFPYNQSRTLPYDHPVNMATLLLCPLYSGSKKAQSVIVFISRSPLIQPPH